MVTRLVENTTYYDLFVGVFIVETRERRGEQAVLALFTNIEYHKDSLITK